MCGDVSNTGDCADRQENYVFQSVLVVLNCIRREKDRLLTTMK